MDLSGLNTSILGNICTTQNTVNISSSDAESWLYRSYDYWVALYVVPFIMVLGFVGNGAFLFMVYRLPYMRTTLNIYLVNLAISDLLHNLITPSYQIHAYVSSPLYFNHPFVRQSSCIVTFGIVYLTYYASVALIIVISFERYNAIFHPLRHMKTEGRSRTLRVVAATWISAFVLACVTILRRGELNVSCFRWPQDEKYRKLPTIYRDCGPIGDNDNITISITLLYIMWFFVALIISGYLYAKIILALSRRSEIVGRTNENGTMKRQLTQTKIVRNQVARTLTILGLEFFITQLPIRIGDIGEILTLYNVPVSLTADQTAIFMAVGLCCLYLNAAVNSYIYAFSSSFYRQAFIEAFQFSTKCNVNSNKGIYNNSSNTSSHGIGINTINRDKEFKVMSPELQ